MLQCTHIRTCTCRSQYLHYTIHAYQRCRKYVAAGRAIHNAISSDSWYLWTYKLFLVTEHACVRPATFSWLVTSTATTHVIWAHICTNITASWYVKSVWEGHDHLTPQGPTCTCMYIHIQMYTVHNTLKIWYSNTIILFSNFSRKKKRAVSGGTLTMPLYSRQITTKLLRQLKWWCTYMYMCKPIIFAICLDQLPP